MAGFWDLLALLLGWKSAPPSPAPYRVAAGDVWLDGALVGTTFVAGQQAGDVYNPGQVAGAVRG